MIQEICVIDDNGADLIVDIRKAFMEKKEETFIICQIWARF